MVDLTNVSVNPLEQFVLLAKNAKGAAAVELIKQALEAPAVFVFGELLDMANIQVVVGCGLVPVEFSNILCNPRI